MKKSVTNAITKAISFPLFALITAIAVFSGAFYSMNLVFSQQIQAKNQFVEDCLSKISNLNENISNLTLESLQYEREARIYEELSAIQEMRASIFASRTIKIKCKEERQALGINYFSYWDVVFIKYYFAYTDDFSVVRKDDSIEVNYGKESFIAPYTIDDRLVDQNRTAELLMSIEKDDHIVDIISAEQKNQASEIEDILISKLVDESKKTDVPLLVNGTPILEWNDECKLYHKTSIPEFDGYQLERPSAGSEN